MINIYISWNFYSNELPTATSNGTFTTVWIGDDNSVKSNQKIMRNKRRNSQHSTQRNSHIESRVNFFISH